MANRAFLIQAVTPTPFRYDDASPDVLAAAKNCIPIYWYSLFGTDCIAPNLIQLSDGRSMTYPCFVTSTTEARARCLRRWGILQRLTPDRYAEVLNGWARFLDGVELPYVHLNTAEFCMLADDLDEHLAACLRAFDSPPPASSPFSSSPAWSEMLDVAQIDADDLAGTVAAHKLAGYQWTRPVPWSSKT